MIGTTYEQATAIAATKIARKKYSAPRYLKSRRDSEYSSATMPVWATEALSVYTPSITSSLFLKLNGALAVAIEAEHDIEHINVWNPAIDHWLREAERAWGAVNDVGKALRAAAVTRAEDRPLVTMAGIADAIMNSATMSELGAAHNRLRAATFFRQHLRRDVPNRISKMLDQCHAHLLEVAELDLYQPVCDSEDLPHGLSDAWLEAC